MSTKKNKIKIISMILFSLLVIPFTGCESTASSSNSSKSWSPKSTVEIVAPAAPGGGWDTLARTMQKTLDEDKLVDKSMIITNKPGGGGSSGWTYLKNKSGKGEYLAVNSSLLLLNNLTGSSKLTYNDFTPLAMLETEWETVAVSADSKWKTAKDFFDALKKDPTSIPIAVGPALGNDDHLQFLMLAKAYGVDISKLKFVVYSGAGGEEIPALLGGHVKAITISVAETLEECKAGKIRLLGISSDKRIDSLPNVPTWKEQGIDVVFAHWRGVMGPPNMTPAQIKYWDDVIAKMVKQDSWKESMKKQDQNEFYMPADECKKYLEKQNNSFKDLLTEVGLIK